MPFRKEFFIALNNWQKGWRESQEKKNGYAELLKNECKLINNKYKRVSGPCYRKRFIQNGEMVDIILKDYKSEGLASWTTDVRYAEMFKGKYRDDAVTAAVFERNPTEDEVILNLSELWQCSDFVEELEKFNEDSPEDCCAIYNFKDMQKEVILEAVLKGSEICMLSGKSSSFDDLCDSLNIPEPDRPAEFKRLIDGGAFIEEVRYIGDQAARNAIQNTILKFYERLEKANENNKNNQQKR